MSIYRELRRGPVRAVGRSRSHGPSVSTSRSRPRDTILGRLRMRQEGMRNRRSYRIRNRPRPRPRATTRDVRVETSSVSDKEKEEVAEVENTLDKEEETSRIDEETLARLKDECLLVEDVELHINENAEAHHTDLFDCTDRDLDPQLVVRRGQEFKLTLTFQRPWSSKDDDMYLIFELGENPNPRKGTYAEMKLEEGKDTSYMTGKKKEWGARILGQADNTLTVGVYPPPDLIVGEWEYSVRTVKVKDNKRENYECDGNEEVIILLNPWCQDDQVYMEKTDDLKEYISNEVGLVFSGSYKNIESKPWDYGQFHKGILEASLHILRKANDFKISSKMGDAVYIGRALSKILNNIDDGGVLVGRWDGNYGDGTKPLSWKGSVNIIEQYMATGQPVKYGQCWVFSHLLTTVARALGLPCRSVTNFSSAHDTDLTMTIDKYVDEEGDELRGKNSDSVWNFHVWNEVWIRRPDLDKLTGQKGKYDGWHVVDATPQELSDSVFQCGPSPLAAIKEGDVHIGFDTRFIFGEVNAEICTWQDGNPPKLISKNSNRVGQKISTKWPNGSSVGYYSGGDNGVRLDLTSSAAEREVVEKATKKGKLGAFLDDNKSGVEVSIYEIERQPRVGKDITVKVKVKNSSSEKRSVRLRTTVRPTNYWGGLIGKQKVATKLYGQDLLGPGLIKVYELPVDAEDIVKLCDESLSMKILTICKVQKFSEPVFASEELVVKTPGIKCVGPSGKLAAGEAFDVELTLKNPISRQRLTNCELSIEGSVEVLDGEFRKQHSSYVKTVGELKPGEIRTLKVKVKPTKQPSRSRERELNLGMASNELPDFVGNLHIDLS
ncbi:glutamine gamma-glutamyltransferase k [Plakobranchus ocellatus]|uniref:Glutamine gamma-glutamyltransferase k n=1 Tax=Plakobranchus ocellatus TaxID=259542 RepID=A0AAV4CSE5_9GAST|nr:glutamine gamma-glutamyltransferase k [Plakobranchus ocellatus]